ncbi:MAG: DUF167 domain-containing protein [Candidatus Omnitrophica bacterium]|nr:DUF167 domain-containing protein [Candidatus Omnitrophota bacterium]
MFINIKVITNAAKNEITEQAKGQYLVKVTASPERGKANKRVMELLAEYFAVPKMDILIVKGKYNSKKLLNIINKKQINKQTDEEEV